MKKYIIPINLKSDQLNNFVFKDPLVVEIKESQIKFTYKSIEEKNTNKLGIYFKGQIIEENEKLSVIGTFHYSKLFIAITCSFIILVYIAVFLFASRDFIKTFTVNMSILIFIYLNIRIRCGYLYQKANIIQSFLKSIDNKDINFLDVNDFYQEIPTNGNLKIVLSILGIVCFFVGLFGVLIFGLSSKSKIFEISKEYSPLYDIEDFLVDEEGRFIVKCSNYTEVFDYKGNFLMKINHGGECSTYVEVKGDLVYFLVDYKNSKNPDYYNEFIVNISEEKIIKHNTYKEDDPVFSYNFEDGEPIKSDVIYDFEIGKTKFIKDGIIYKIKSDKISINEAGKKKFVNLQSPKWPPYFGYFLILSFLGVGFICIINIDNMKIN